MNLTVFRTWGIAKLQLVAEPKTVLIVNELASLYGELRLRLTLRAVPLQKDKTRDLDQGRSA